MAEPAGQGMPLKLGLLIALRREAVGLDQSRLGQLGCSFQITGPGPEAARAGARRLLEQGVRLLLSWGSAGALDDLAPGTVHVPDRVRSASGVEMFLDASFSELLAQHFEPIGPVHRGLLFSAAQPIRSASDKRALRGQTGAVAVDMETHAIAVEAAARGAAAAALRVIVDAQDMPLPPAALAALDGPSIRIDRLLASLIRQPQQIPALVALARASGRARAGLRACARRMPDLLAGREFGAFQEADRESGVVERNI